MTLALKQPHFRRAVFPLPALKQIEMREMTAQVSDTEKVRWLRIGGPGIRNPFEVLHIPGIP